ncbi:MAG: archaellin/type IV pilin N-terminal domain-containing protein [Candidatus Jordarchaeaceae archaeon]
MSPIVGVVLVLAVTIAAGVALYVWWNSMQASTQTTVGEQAKGQVNKMILDTATVSIIIPGHMVGVNEKYNYKYTSTSFDWDNNKLIYKASSTNGAYVGTTTYVNCSKDERFIVEIPVIIRNDNAIDLTNVKLVVGGLEGRLWFVLHFKKASNGQYILLDKNGNEFNGIFGYENASSSTSYFTYYWGEPGSYGITENKTMYKYDFNSNNLITTTDIWQVDYQNWNDRKTTIFANYTTSPMVLRDEFGNNLYPYALDKNGNRYAWATWNNFFTGKSGGPTYAFCKDNLHNPVYEVGTIKAGESVKTYIYIMFGYLAERTGTLPDWEITLEVFSDEGVYGSIPVKFHLEDPDWK